MKFEDLPIGTKFVDNIAIEAEYDYLVKISEISYNYDGIGLEWRWSYITDVYPILEWEE